MLVDPQSAALTEILNLGSRDSKLKKAGAGLHLPIINQAQTEWHMSRLELIYVDLFRRCMADDGAHEPQTVDKHSDFSITVDTALVETQCLRSRSG